MQAYHNTAILQFDDESTGNAGSGLPVTIRVNSSQSLATVFNLDDVEIANPIITDIKGNYSFKVDDGLYDIIINESTGSEVKLEKVQISEFTGLINDLSQSYDFETVEAMKDSTISFPLNKKITVKERITDSGGELTFDVVATSSVTTNGIDIVESVGVPTQSFKQRYNNKDGLPQMQKITASLEADIGGVIMLVVGDSTGNETEEWVYLLLESLADRYPSYSFEWRVWNTGTDSYDSPITISTGSGANTFTCYNASIPGEEATFVKGEIYPTITNVQAFLTLVNFGHNGLVDPENQRTELAAFTCAMANDYPDRPIVLIGQNPRTDNATMDGKVREFKEFAAEQGYGFIDVYSGFNQLAKPLGDYMDDELHPNILGSHLEKSIVLRSFGLSKIGGSGLPRNNMSEIVLYSACDSKTLESWTLIGSTVASKDSNSGFYETAGGSTKLTSVGAGGMNEVIISPDDIVQWRGKWVTFAVRIQVPSGEVDDCGKIALYDGVNTVTTFKGSPESHGSTFFWQVVSIKVAASAPNLRAYVYTDTGATGGTAYVERLTVSSGRSPKDDIPKEVTNLRDVNTDNLAVKSMTVEDAIESLAINNELTVGDYILMKNIAIPDAPLVAGEFKLFFHNNLFRYIDHTGTVTPLG